MGITYKKRLFANYYLLDLRKIPAGSESPGKHLNLSLLDDPDSSQVLRKSGLLFSQTGGR